MVVEMRIMCRYFILRVQRQCYHRNKLSVLKKGLFHMENTDNTFQIFLQKALHSTRFCGHLGMRNIV